MIPKKIHYCWFGGRPLPPLARKCLASWKKYCPDYEIIEWNERNFDLTMNEYVRWCYAHKKWAYLSDYARLAAVYAQGGIYFDTDVELIRRIDRLLSNEAFYAFENDQYVASGLGFGAEAGHETLRRMMEPYEALHEDAQGQMRMTGCPISETTKAAMIYTSTLRKYQHSSAMTVNIAVPTIRRESLSTLLSCSISVLY